MGEEGEQWRTLLNCSGKDIRSYPVFSNPVTTAGAVLTTTMSVLSILGCLLIMFTYFAYKELRTYARAMLFHLSIADLIIVISHVVGYYENYMWYLKNPSEILGSSTNALCASQAAFLIFGSIASLMWSTVVGLFMVVLAVNSKQRRSINKAFYIISCIVCWLVPLVITICIAVYQLLGFVLAGATSCYIINYPARNITKEDYATAEFFSYELWLYLSFILLPFFYSIVFYHTQCKLRRKYEVLTAQGKNSPEFKLLLVPTIFIFLRIWGGIIEVMVYFSGGFHAYGCSRLAAVMSLVDGVGINAQGLANGIFFCLLTKPVRIRLKGTARKLLLRLRINKNDDSALIQELNPSSESKDRVVLSDTYEAVNS